MKLQHFLMLALASMIAVLATILYAAFLIFYPFKSLVVKNFSYDNPIHVDTQVVHPGNSISYRLDYCKYADVNAIVYRTLVDGQIITLTPTTGNLPLGCHSTEVSTAKVPDTINPGRYYLDVTVDYRVNMLQDQRIHYYTDYFQVVPERVSTTSVQVAATSTVPHPILGVPLKY